MFVATLIRNLSTETHNYGSNLQNYVKNFIEQKLNGKEVESEYASSFPLEHIASYKTMRTTLVIEDDAGATHLSINGNSRDINLMNRTIDNLMTKYLRGEKF